MSGFDADAAELFAAQAQLGTAAGDGRSALKRLVAAADDVLGHGWRGPAAHAFGEAWSEWHDGARSLLVALDDLAEAFGACGRAYAIAEDANVVGTR